VCTDSYITWVYIGLLNELEKIKNSSLAFLFLLSPSFSPSALHLWNSHLILIYNVPSSLSHILILFYLYQIFETRTGTHTQGSISISLSVSQKEKASEEFPVSHLRGGMPNSIWETFLLISFPEDRINPIKNQYSSMCQKLYASS